MTACRILIVTTAIVASLTTNMAFAQTDADRTIEQYSCKDLMREGGDSRDIAIAFLHGYILGKSGTSKFNLSVLEKQTDAFIDYCLEHSAEKAEAAMNQLKK